MPKRTKRDEYESDSFEEPTPSGQLSTEGQWLFGALYAVLVVLGFGFGVWAGVSKSKPVEVADNKPSDKQPEKPKAPVVTPPTSTPTPPATTPVVTKPPEPEPEPEPKPKEPEPKPKPKDDPKPPPVVEPKKPDVKAVSFKEIKPILVGYCGNCHGSAGKAKGGVNLLTVAAIMKGGENGDILKAGDPKKSKLYTLMLPDSDNLMPPNGKGPNEKELKLIHDWILSGAKE